MNITVNQLSVYRSKKCVVQIGSLVLDSDDAIALIGPNGSGKSTLMRALAGINNDYHGEIFYDKKNISLFSGQQRAETIGFIPQNFVPHWDNTAQELIELVGKVRHYSPYMWSSVMSQFELDYLADHYWSTLSGGERARVVCAMASIGEPLVLFADEPGAALDVKHRLQLIKYLTSKRKEQLVVVCLHELDMAFRFFKKILLVHEGRVVFYGDSQDLLHDKLLDQTFGVLFSRTKTEQGYALEAVV